MRASIRHIILFAFLSAVMTIPASAAQLVLNGDFEMVDGRVGLVRGKALDDLAAGRWDVYESLPGGWRTSNGAGIEVQHSGTVVNAYSGNHYVELDSHPGPDSNSSMSLDIVFEPAADHELSFMYFPRTSVLGDNGIRVLIDDTEVLSVDDFRQPGTTWQRYAVQLLGYDAGPHTLTFTAFGIENTLGGFIDDVSLVSSGSSVPEPSAALVYSIGLLVFAGNRKRQRA